ncbi:MAG: septum formation initiator family protein [bacterium]|nr:septum formation initiator family protein [bacterium]
MRTKKENKRLFFISFIIIGLVFLLGFTVYKDFIIISKNRNQTNKLTKEYEQLLDEKKLLTSQVTKMQDPEYLARYAKEKYLYSKEDEVIIRID